MVSAESTPGHKAPRFLGDLSSITVVEGSAAKLDVQLGGVPEPKVRWLKDGKPLLTDGVRMITSMKRDPDQAMDDEICTCQLVIKEPLPRDSGTYTCVAMNCAGTSITEAAIHVRDMSMRPSSRLHQREMSVEHGRSSSVLSDYSRLRRRMPEFTRRLRNLQVNIGRSIRLYASVIATPNASVTWLKDGRPIVSQQLEDKFTSSHNRIQAKNTSGHLELKIDNALESDMGQYTVIAFNGEGEAKCSCYVTALKDDLNFQIPSFVESVKDYTVMEGQTLAIEVRATALPAPQFKWEKDGFEILPDQLVPRMIPEVIGEGHAVLTIHKVESRDAGLYTCVAHNRYGRQRSTGIVSVESLPRSANKAVTQARGSSYSMEYTSSSFRSKSVDISRKSFREDSSLPPKFAAPSSKVETPSAPVEFKLVAGLPKTVDLVEGDALNLSCIVLSNIHYIG
ncbi:hypothetical protein Ciccas_000134 [Cichlidogyrus casuarinus]|uniref:Ig-like domain-containing protein n=1 Tax=Cichlidogyrus casuarinus TaxID=1844966 RepID=A0ABD2QP52_9PLAT